MFSDRDMKVLAESRYRYLGQTDAEAAETDLRLLSDCRQITPEEMVQNAWRIRALKNAGLLTSTIRKDGSDGIAPTESTAYWLTRYQMV